MTTISLSHINHTAGDRPVLQDITWTLHSQARWAILGPNGCGKTTLLKVACGWLYPNAGGAIERDGKRMHDVRAWRANIGWVSVDMMKSIPRHDTVEQTVLTGAVNRIGWNTPGERVTGEDEAKAEALLALLGIASLRHQAFETLSQGERQKTLLARAWLNEPDLIVLDEPCAGLDPGAREQYLDALAAIASQQGGPGVMYVTHHVEEILPAFDQLMIMREGRILETGSRDAILTPMMMQSLYGVDVELIERGGRFWPIRTIAGGGRSHS